MSKEHYFFITMQVKIQACFMCPVVVEARLFAADSLDKWVFQGIFAGNDHSCRKNEKQPFFGKNVSLTGLHTVKRCYRAAVKGKGVTGRQDNRLYL